MAVLHSGGCFSFSMRLLHKPLLYTDNEPAGPAQKCKDRAKKPTIDRKIHIQNRLIQLEFFSFIFFFFIHLLSKKNKASLQIISIYCFEYTAPMQDNDYITNPGSAVGCCLFLLPPLLPSVYSRRETRLQSQTTKGLLRSLPPWRHIATYRSCIHKMVKDDLIKTIYKVASFFTLDALEQ